MKYSPAVYIRSSGALYREGLGLVLIAIVVTVKSAIVES